MLAVNGFQVTGVDPRAEAVDAVNSGDVHIEEVGLKTLVQAAVNSGKLRAQREPGPADVFIIAVPTPVTADHKADLSYVEKAARSIAPHLQRGNLVVLESTVPPGTTTGPLARTLEESGLKAGVDFYLAHCPERILPGNILTELVKNDRVVGGIDAESAERAAAVYRQIVEGEVFTTSAVAAELAKIIENASRDVAISFANEVARISHHWGVSGREVIALANRHPRVAILQPGPGVGGHCIPVDPWFLVDATPELAQVIHTARKMNDAQPVWVAERAAGLLAGLDKPKVSLWGVAYKGNVDDARETPAVTVIRALQERGITVSPVDFRVKRFTYELHELEASLTGADCVLLLADHREFAFLEPEMVGSKMRSRILFDTRHSLPHDRWQQAGFRVETL
jgi:UDP-N-acetyl-D-mannosaminuronic acid dehydrogenase